jgi:hypothetical protein
MPEYALRKSSGGVHSRRLIISKTLRLTGKANREQICVHLSLRLLFETVLAPINIGRDSRAGLRVKRPLLSSVFNQNVDY